MKIHFQVGLFALMVILTFTNRIHAADDVTTNPALNQTNNQTDIIDADNTIISPSLLYGARDDNETTSVAPEIVTTEGQNERPSASISEESKSVSVTTTNFSIQNQQTTSHSFTSSKITITEDPSLSETTQNSLNIEWETSPPIEALHVTKSDKGNKTLITGSTNTPESVSSSSPKVQEATTPSKPLASFTNTTSASVKSTTAVNNSETISASSSALSSTPPSSNNSENTKPPSSVSGFSKQNSQASAKSPKVTFVSKYTTLPTNVQNTPDSLKQTEAIPAFNFTDFTTKSDRLTIIYDESDFDDPDAFWPIAMALTIGVPTIIVLAITITVLYRRRRSKPRSMLELYGHDAIQM